MADISFARLGDALSATIASAPPMNHQTRVYDSILELLPTVDNPTPLLRLHRVVPFKHAQVYAKLEWYNPFGAVKDRVAASLLRDAEARGLVSPGTQLVEPSSGNTGMGLAMLANAKGYKLTVTLSNKIPAEKRASLRLFGSELVELDDDLCPAPGAPEGAIALAAEMGARPGYYHPNQYKNLANPEAHYRTTGPEIWRQTDGKITHFVAGLGTCGTITGTGRFLKEQRADVRVLGVHPVEGHDIPGVRSIRQLQQTALFFPKEYDGLIDVNNDEAFELCRRINQEESVIAGPSSGMALAGALKLVPDEPGVVCVVIFPDNAFKYASSMRKHLPELFKGAKPEAAAGNSNLANIVEFARGSADVIDPLEAKALLDGAAAPTLLDVRSAEEYAAEHVPGAINVPLDELAGGYATGFPEDKSASLLTVCKVGERSLYGMLLLKALGYQQVKNVRGGLKAWTAAGLPSEASAAARKG
jgi:cysteine synthase/rhodanese-related sulfurtransferase